MRIFIRCVFSVFGYSSFFAGVAVAAQGEGLLVKEMSCEAINKAIQSLPSKGGTVLLPAGQIDCDQPIVLDRSNINLRGQGQDKTKIRLKDKVGSPLIIIGSLKILPQKTQKNGIQYYPVVEVKNVEVSDLSVDGNWQSHKSPDTNADPKLGKEVSISNNECYDVAEKKSKSCDNDGGRLVRNNGFTVRHSSNIRILNVTAENCLSGGMVLEKRSSDVTVENFISRKNFFDGFAGYETENSHFKNILLEKNVMSGISIDFLFERNHFEKIRLIDNGDNGIFSGSGGSNTFKEVEIRGNKNFGIYIDGIRIDGLIVENTCDGDQFINVKERDSGNGALRINHPCQKILLQDFSSNQKNEDKCLSFFEGAEIDKKGTYHCGAVAD